MVANPLSDPFSSHDPIVLFLSPSRFVFVDGTRVLVWQHERVTVDGKTSMKWQVIHSFESGGILGNDSQIVQAIPGVNLRLGRFKTASSEKYLMLLETSDSASVVSYWSLDTFQLRHKFFTNSPAKKVVLEKSHRYLAFLTV